MVTMATTAGGIPFLDDDSPIAAPLAEGFQVTLMVHQLAALHRCRQLEASSLDGDGGSILLSSGGIQIVSRGDTAQTPSLLHTRIGILADTVGSGKSMIILALAWDDNEDDARDDDQGDDDKDNDDRTQTRAVRTGVFHNAMSSHGCNQVVLRSPETGRRIDTTVVVVPHALCSQWKTYLTDAGYVPVTATTSVMSSLDQRLFTVVSTAKAVETLTPAVLQACRIVVVTASNYACLVTVLVQHGLRARRFVFDEADTLPLTVTVPPARFCWFVTASFSSLFHPLGNMQYFRATVDAVLESPFLVPVRPALSSSATATATSSVTANVADRGEVGSAHIGTSSTADRGPAVVGVLRHTTGFTRAVFKDLFETAPSTALVRALVVRCDDAFVGRSLRLPPIVHTVVRCRTSHALLVLDGIVDRSVLDALNAGDDVGALRMAAINSRVVSNDESIVTLTMERVARQLNNAHCHLDLAAGGGVDV